MILIYMIFAMISYMVFFITIFQEQWGHSVFALFMTACILMLIKRNEGDLEP